MTEGANMHDSAHNTVICQSFNIVPLVIRYMTNPQLGKNNLKPSFCFQADNGAEVFFSLSSLAEQDSKGTAKARCRNPVSKPSVETTRMFPFQRLSPAADGF